MWHFNVNRGTARSETGVVGCMAVLCWLGDNGTGCSVLAQIFCPSAWKPRIISHISLKEMLLQITRAGFTANNQHEVLLRNESEV